MSVTLRVYGDDSGETHLGNIDFPSEDRCPDGRLVLRALRDVPTTTLSIGEMMERRPTRDLHPPPRRQFVIVVRGQFEITTTAGDVHRFGPGDCLFADDMDSKGHTFEDVGDDLLITMTVGVDPDWKIPAAHHEGR